MGSLRFGGIVFQVYSFDHSPPHVHARYAEIEVILELTNSGVELASRPDAFTPRGGKLSDLRRVIRMARRHQDELRDLWRQTHG